MDFARRHADGVAALALLLLPLAIFGPALVSGRVASPANLLFETYPWNAIAPGPPNGNPALTDIVQVFHPWVVHAAHEIRQGRFPLWNPYEYAGVPFFANPQTALLFPLTALAYVLPVTTALTLIAWLKHSAAGLAMYWFLRVLALGPIPAVAGAVAFMLSAPLVGWLHWTFASTIIFLPLLLGVTERLRERGGWRLAGALAVVVALDLLAGYPQSALHALVTASAWALARAIATRAGIGFLARYATGVALGAALAAVQLVPFVEYTLESAVWAYRSEWTPALWVPVRSAITYLMPHFYGSGREYWGDWQFAIVVGSVGLVPWAVLPVALWAGWRRVGTAFFAALALVAAGVYHGFPVLGALATLPGMALGTNLRLMPLVALALSVLGAIGLDTLSRGEGAWRRSAGYLVQAWFVALVVLALWWIAEGQANPRAAAMQAPLSLQYLGFLVLLTLTVLVVLRWLSEPGRAHHWGLALVGLELASLLPLAATYNAAVDARWFYPAPPAIRHLQRETHDRSRVLMPGTVGIVYGLFEAQGYDGMTPRRIEQIVGYVGTGKAIVDGFLENTVGLHGSEPLSPVKVLLSPAFDLLGIRYVVVPPGASSPRPDLTLDYDGPDARIYRSDRALPRAFLVARGRCVGDAVALGLMWEKAVDYREEVLLADCERAEPAGPRGNGWRAEIREYGPDRVLVLTTAEAPAYLVLTDTWFPGWRAWVDGRETSVRRADHALRAVWLATGRHEVEFRYRPASVQLGLAVSGLAACLTAVLCVVGRGGSRPGQPETAAA
ncbi:MAG: YfhO family protein [Candidatus Rokubacteria bacterium]|nr:YfhO family protein [Candidatus Rokubacteria bacterium]